jgi:hypothetical protein
MVITTSQIRAASKEYPRDHFHRHRQAPPMFRTHRQVAGAKEQVAAKVEKDDTETFKGRQSLHRNLL